MLASGWLHSLSLFLYVNVMLYYGASGRYQHGRKLYNIIYTMSMNTSQRRSKSFNCLQTFKLVYVGVGLGTQMPK